MVIVGLFFVLFEVKFDRVNFKYFFSYELLNFDGFGFVWFSLVFCFVKYVGFLLFFDVFMDFVFLCLCLVEWVGVEEEY